VDMIDTAIVPGILFFILLSTTLTVP
jgi:hypothetical protein